MVYDINDGSYGTAYGAIAINFDGPPLANGKRTSILLQEDYIDLDYSTTCVTDLDLCTDGLSFSLWLKIESLLQTTGYYLVAGSGSTGFSIVSPLEGGMTSLSRCSVLNLKHTIRSTTFNQLIFLPFLT